MTYDANKQFTSLVLIGFGRIAEVLYGPYINKHYKEVHICEPNTTRHELIRSILPNAQIFSDLKQLEPASDSKSFAFNLVPGPSHEDISNKLLEKGWNVFTEKPAATSANTWNSMVKNAEEKGLVLLSAPITAYMPDVQKIKNQLNINAIGDLSEVHLTFFAGGPARGGFIDESRKWFFGEESCVIRDLGPYAISTLIHLLGEPVDFFWKRNTFCPSIAIKPSGSIIPKFGAAAVGIGRWQDSIVTVSLAYRPTIENVEANMMITGNLGSIQCELDDQPINGIHQDTKASLAFMLIERGLSDRTFWLQHTKEVASTLAILELGPGLS